GRRRRTADAKAVEAALRQSAVALGYLKAHCVATTPLAERLPPGRPGRTTAHWYREPHPGGTARSARHPRLAVASLGRDRGLDLGLDLGDPLVFGDAVIPGLDPLAKRIETRLHAANTLEKARIDECCDGLAVLVDHHAVVAVLHLVEHLAEVLAKADGAGLR